MAGYQIYFPTFYAMNGKKSEKKTEGGEKGEKKHFDEMINVRMVNQLSLTTGDYFFCRGLQRNADVNPREPQRN